MALPEPRSRDTACFVQARVPLHDWLALWRRSLPGTGLRAVLVGEPGSPLLSAWRRLPEAPAPTTLTPRAAGLLEKPFSMARIETTLLHEMGGEPHDPRALARTLLLVDMDWLLQTPSAMANGAIWGTIIERLLGAGVHGCLSLYHRRHLPERDLLAGLHAHASVLAADGCHPNPYQLPPELAGNAGSTQAARLRLDHWLSHLSPTLRAADAPDTTAAGTAAGGPLSGGESNTLLLERASPEDETGTLPGLPRDRWKIRCFGSLRAYRIDGQAIQWQGEERPGRAGATRKLRGLFAMLLMAGDRGVSAAELIDVLWPEAEAPEKALNRLHHTVNELRRRLLPAGLDGEAVRARQHPYVVRQDQRYFLRPPPNSWLDLEEFPQLCRQGGELLRDGRLQEALLCFESALKLYSGDLFADLPAALTDGADADWCASARAWYRELYYKVHGDCARIHRELGNPLQAAAHCQQLLQQDACSGFANAELMRLHAAQGRRDALDRQFQRYRQALLAAGHPDSAPIPLMDLYVELMRNITPVQTPRSARR